MKSLTRNATEKRLCPLLLSVEVSLFGKKIHRFLLELGPLFGRLEGGGETQSEVLSVMGSGFLCGLAPHPEISSTLPQPPCPLQFSQPVSPCWTMCRPSAGSPPRGSSLFEEAPRCAIQETPFRRVPHGAIPSQRLGQASSAWGPHPRRHRPGGPRGTHLPRSRQALGAQVLSSPHFLPLWPLLMSPSHTAAVFCKRRSTQSFPNPGKANSKPALRAACSDYSWRGRDVQA